MADLTFTLTIPDAKVAAAKAAFLARRPKPTEEPDSLLTDKQWIEKVISKMVNREIQLGKAQLDAPAPDSTDYFEP